MLQQNTCIRVHYVSLPVGKWQYVYNCLLFTRKEVNYQDNVYELWSNKNIRKVLWFGEKFPFITVIVFSGVTP